MIATFDQSQYDEAEWPKLWRLEGLVNSVLEAHRFKLAGLPLCPFVALLFRRVVVEARHERGVPLEMAWVRQVLLREAVPLKRAAMGLDR